MATNRSFVGQPVSVAETLRARADADGLSRHPHLAALLGESGAKCGRDLSDAVHLLCALHGRFPGLVAIAAREANEPTVKAWLDGAADAFEVERHYLLQLTAMVGPIPSTPGAAQSEASLLAARNAVETLGLSERHGCALGAASALFGDWPSIRSVLDRAAARAGIERPSSALPSDADTAAVLDYVAQSPAAARALAFGADQMLAQHRALFALLEARAEARTGF